MEVPEEQPPKKARETTEAVVVVDHPLDTEDKGDPRAEVEQPEPSRVGEPEQQQPEMGGPEELEQQQQQQHEPN